jgi:hypothetical protein
MSTYFQSWRRKVGCATLVMACLLAGLWLRSVTIVDDVFIAPSRAALVMFSSERSRVGGSLDVSGAFTPLVQWSARPVSWENNSFGYVDDDYSLRWGGIDIGASSNQDFMFCVAPYWTIVLPLTLLSAYLILWTPKRRSG